MSNLTKLLSLTGLVLIVILAVELRTSTEVAINHGNAAKSASNPPTTDGFTLPPLSQLADFSARPLFSSNRRASEPVTTPQIVAADTTAKEDDLFDLKLTAIVIDTNQRLAVIHDLRTNKRLKVRVGGLVNGWMVAQIHSDRVTLQHDQDLEELPLRQGDIKP